MYKFLATTIRALYLRVRCNQFKSTDPIPLENWDALKARHDPHNRITDILTPPFRKGTPYTGKIPQLMSALSELELGLWAIDSKAADRIWHYLDERHPSAVLEFGSGSSTCVFAAWMKANNPSGIVISVDQHEDEAKKTRELLNQRELASCTQVISMPLRTNDRYDIDLKKLQKLLEGRTVDILFTDGPAGQEGCRDNTLTETRPLMSNGALWFLHDALRDGEMNILRKWRAEGATVFGIIPFGMGLAVGTFYKQD